MYIFWCAGVQTSCTKLLQILHDSCVQTEWEREEAGIWAKDHGDWAWVLYATSSFSNRWHGASCVHGLQENGIFPGREKVATLLQDHGMASVCIQFFFDPLSHPVYSWHQIGQTQARQTVSGITNWSSSRGLSYPWLLMDSIIHDQKLFPVPHLYKSCDFLTIIYTNTYNRKS